RRPSVQHSMVVLEPRRLVVVPDDIVLLRRRWWKHRVRVAVERHPRAQDEDDAADDAADRDTGSRRRGGGQAGGPYGHGAGRWRLDEGAGGEGVGHEGPRRAEWADSGR